MYRLVDWVLLDSRQGKLGNILHEACMDLLDSLFLDKKLLRTGLRQGRMGLQQLREIHRPFRVPAGQGYPLDHTHPDCIHIHLQKSYLYQIQVRFVLWLGCGFHHEYLP